MVGDQLNSGQFISVPAQYAASNTGARNHFLRAIDYDRQRNYDLRDNQLRTILTATDPRFRDRNAIEGSTRVGNSMQDLRLSVKGWRFGQETRNGPIQSRQEAADWLRREVYDPFRSR